MVLKLSFVITGTAFAITMVVAGTGIGVRLLPFEAANAAVMVMVPAVVPVNTETPDEPKLACVLPAGMVNAAVRVPLENLINGSSGPTAEAKVNVSVPVIVCDAALPKLTVVAGCCAGPCVPVGVITTVSGVALLLINNANGAVAFAGVAAESVT